MPQKSKLSHLTDIYQYINAVLMNQPEEKILFSDTLNIESTTHEEIIAEMSELAYQSRAKNPFVHTLLSFAEDESIDEKTTKEIVQKTLDGLGYNGCQCAYAVHRNTQHVHIHLLINRVDKEQKKCRNDYNDVEKLHKIIAKLSNEYNFSTNEHDRYIMDDDGNLQKLVYVNTIDSIIIPDAARASEIRSGEQSIQRIAANEVLPILKDAQTWYELHQRLAAIGFSYVKKGGGAVLKGTRNDNSIVEIKPSSLHKKASLKYMEERLGKYEGYNITPTPRSIDPMPGVDKNILQAYKNEQQQIQDSKKLHEEKLYKEFKQEREKIKQEKQLILNSIKQEEFGNKTDYLALKQVIKEKTNEEIAKLEKKYKEKVANIKKIYASIINFDAWCKLHKPDISIDIEEKIREAGNRIILSSTINHTQDSKVQQFEIYSNAVNADRYRITLQNDNNDNTSSVLILDSDHDGISRGYTQEQVMRAIPQISYYESKGDHAYFTPLSDNKHHILLDNITQENLHYLQEDGFIPNCILQLSPSNYQAIYTLSKLKTDNDKYIYSDIARELNTKYVDHELCCAIYSHRIPGFHNTKSKYRNQDGTFPIVKIVDTCEEECSLLVNCMFFLDGYYNYKKENSSLYVPEQQSIAAVYDIIKLYNLHKNECVRLAKLTNSMIDHSRLDAMIAIRLRATGHTKDEIAYIILQSTPDRAKHNFDKYSQKTAEYAFSVHGDIEIEKLRKYIWHWRALERSLSRESSEIQTNTIVVPAPTSS
mgnify:CR=1 FL=1